jgi:L-2-hydroxyglutarate oxidase LhgO
VGGGVTPVEHLIKTLRSMRPSPELSAAIDKIELENLRARMEQCKSKPMVVGDLTARHLGWEITINGEEHGELYSMTRMADDRIALHTDKAIEETEKQGQPGEYGAHIVAIDTPCEVTP